MIRRRAATALMAVVLCVGVSACAHTTEKVATSSIDLAEAVDRIAESAGTDQVQSLTLSTAVPDVVARMVVAGHISTWWWDGEGEPRMLDAEPRDYDRWPQTPTDTTTMVQAVLALPKCPRGSVRTEALTAEVVQVQMDCLPSGAEDRVQRTYLGGEEMTADRLELTDPDRLSTAVAEALALLEGLPVNQIQVELGDEPRLLIWLAEPMPTLAGDDITCPAYLDLRIGTNGLPEQMFRCGWEHEGTVLAEPFSAEVALAAHDSIVGAQGVSLAQQGDLPVYRVAAARASYEFDVAGTLLLRFGTIGDAYEPGTYTPVEAVSGDCSWTITPEGGGRDRVETGSASSGRPQVALESGQTFQSEGCGYWQLT